MKTAVRSPGEDSVAVKNTDDIRIAVVEDDPMFRHAVEYYLKKIPGNRVFAFSSGEECFRHYHQLDPEIIILDYKLDDREDHRAMNGLDILSEVKSVDPAKEVLFVSGQENVDIATAAIKGGASAYILKDDLAMNKLMDEVRAMLFNVRHRREEVRNSKRLIALCTFAGFIFLIAYLGGYGWFTLPMKILFAVTGTIAALLLLTNRSKKKMHIASEDKTVKPGDWLD
ncbi:MAG TPA: response regulator transcription factor [Bacteroidia bacterium]|nr:response regulator transcription factor [Bacteroidia bacterium]